MSEQVYSPPSVDWERLLRRCLIWLWRFLPYLYLLRVTLLAGALLVSIPWLAFYGVPSLLANLFDLDASRIFCVTAAALLIYGTLIVRVVIIC